MTASEHRLSSFSTTTTAAAPSSTTKFPFPPLPISSLPIKQKNGVDGTKTNEEERYPVHRIYCVGRNYADHAREMGGDPDREPPFFFTKPADAIVSCCETAATTTIIPYPLATKNLHHEVELVIAIGKAGVQISRDEASGYVFGFAVGVDLTRRDLQAAAKAKGHPWDSAKGFDQSAPISHIVRQQDATFMDNDNDEPNASPKIWLTVNDERKQEGHLSQMIWSITEVVSVLSHQFHLQPGDLIFTGTPAGVGALNPNDTVRCGVEGLAELQFQVGGTTANDR